MTNTIKIFALTSAMLMVAVIVGMVFVSSVQTAQGSITQGSEYIATSTGEYSANGEITSGEISLKTRFGSLGSVVITGDNTGMLHFYDATTSDATQRASVFSTSSIHIASISQSAAENTYVFDALFNTGLLLVVEGTAPTSTVLYR